MSIVRIARLAGDAVLSLLYPPHCAICGADTQPRSHVCAACAGRVQEIQPPFCRTCSQPFEGAINGEFSCSNCADRQFAFDCAVSRYRSTAAVRDLIHSFKYERRFHLRHQLADWLAASLDDDRIRGQPFHAFVPVPLHSARLREREFNQADVLAQLLGRRTDTAVLRCLRRIRYTSTQTRLDREERMENLRGAFRVRQTSLVQSRHLLLVDDVFTTGSTAHECARVLRQAGAASVRVVTVARG